MDELVVLRHVGERVDPVLCDLEPFAGALGLADGSLEQLVGVLSLAPLCVLSRRSVSTPRMPDGSGGRDDRYRPEEDEERVGVDAGRLQRRHEDLHGHRYVVQDQWDDGVSRCPAGRGTGQQ